MSVDAEIIALNARIDDRVASQKLLTPTFPAGVWKDDFAAFVHDVAHARNTHPDMGDFVALQAMTKKRSDRRRLNREEHREILL